MATVTLKPGESQEELLRRFRKKVAESQILSTYRQKRWFVSKGELRRKQKKRAARKIARQQRKTGDVI
ncbi:MAG: 30S ribosomal protein S21 [Chloroflexi bacterium]|nr:30S ribosomal protein S21 [Chloroflexota bacterium]